MTIHQHALGDKLYVYSPSGKPLADRKVGDGTPETLILICHGLYYVSSQSAQKDAGYFPPFQAPKNVAVKFCQRHGKSTSTGEFENGLRHIAEGGVDNAEKDFPYKNEDGMLQDYSLGKGYTMGEAQIQGQMRSVPFRGGKEHKNEGVYQWIAEKYVKTLFGRFPGLEKHVDIARVRKSCNYFSQAIECLGAPNAYTLLLCGFCREEEVVG